MPASPEAVRRYCERSTVPHTQSSAVNHMVEDEPRTGRRKQPGKGGKGGCWWSVDRRGVAVHFVGKAVAGQIAVYMCIGRGALASAERHGSIFGDAPMCQCWGASKRGTGCLASRAPKQRILCRSSGLLALCKGGRRVTTATRRLTASTRHTFRSVLLPPVGASAYRPIRDRNLPAQSSAQRCGLRRGVRVGAL